jgi:hypothetical protein
MLGRQRQREEVAERLGRRDRSDLDLVAFLTVAAADPLATALQITAGDAWKEAHRLAELTAAAATRPVEMRCLDGRRRCPPEDCGGIGGFADLLETMRGPDSEERREMLDWLGGEIDFAAFDPAEVNRQLSRLR